MIIHILVDMIKLTLNADRKYLGIELTYLFFISFMIAIISDLEFSSYEKHDILKFAENLDYRVVCGIFNSIAYGLLYWGFLKRYVFNRKIAAVVLSLAGFVVFYRLFENFVLNWVIIHLEFISSDIRARTLDQIKSRHIYFAINHLLISAIFPLLGLAFFIRTLHHKDEIKLIKEQQLYSELNYLKAQLHPHFFFNTLNNIYALALKQSVETAPMIARLGEMMRYILYEASRPAVLLVREIEFLSNYVAVEQIRHQQNVVIDFDVQGVSSTYRIEPLLLLPFVENAFKHGLEQEIGNGYVNIIICQTEKELLLEVINSKPNVRSSKTLKGIGISNVTRRLDLLYRDQYQLATYDEEKQYRITLTLQATA